MVNDRRRRIAYVVGRYPTTSHTFILREVAELTRLGWDIDRYAIWRSRTEDLLTEEEIAERDRTYSVLPLTPRGVVDLVRAHARALLHPRSYLQTLRSALRLAGPGRRGRTLGASWFAVAILLWHRCRRAGVSHIHVHLAGTATFDAMLAVRFGRSIGEDWGWSMTVHGPYEFFRIDEQRLAEKVREASFIICISDFARSQLMALSEARDWAKLHVSRCGVSSEHFSPRQDRSTGRSDALRILTVGRLDPVKGHGVLLEAVALAKQRGHDVALELIGDGERDAELRRIASELEIEDRVEFRGAVGQDSIRDSYAAADVFCLASFAEGIPVVLMEAMAMELAVVSTHITGIPELIRSGENGLLVRPGRADELVSAFEALADPALRDRLGRAARETIRSEYELAANVGGLDSILRAEL